MQDIILEGVQVETKQPPRVEFRVRILICSGAALLLYVLYFFAMSWYGLLGPDEPRYASIAREMARSSDWLTPRLWGDPWFEKPPLLYWMGALAFRAGFSEDLAPRLPVACLSAAFLFFYYGLLRREFGVRAALFASAILATSAGWLVFSQVSVTDLPMSAAFAAAMLLALPWAAGTTAPHRPRLMAAGALLGVAVLGKGLVPLVLAAPLIWMGRRRLRDLALPVCVMGMVAGPWYLLATAEHGSEFLNEFFWRHHFERLASDSLKHQQPFWFYVPVFAGALFPWIPMLGLLSGKAVISDPRRRFLLYWLLFGFLFFSISTNKLPGYLLPLMPAACALMGVRLAEVRRAAWMLASTALLLALIPLVIAVLPAALASGLSRAGMPALPWVWLAPAAAAAGAVWLLDATGRREAAVGLLIVLLAAGVAGLKIAVAPSLESKVSARSLWRTVQPEAGTSCVERLHRNWRYGLNYYSVTPLPDCEEIPRLRRITQEGTKTPQVMH